MSLGTSEPISIVPTASSTSTKRETGQARSSNVLPVKRSFGAGRSARPWSSGEDQILREQRHLTARQLTSWLPGRTERGIASRSRRIGVFKVWDRHEKTVLFKSPHLTARELQALLPGRTIKAIQNQREAMELTFVRETRDRRKRRLLKRSGNPLVDAVITRCEEDGIGLKTLDREIGTGTYFQSKAVTAKIEHIAKAVAFFGGRGLLIDDNANVTIDWHDE